MLFTLDSLPDSAARLPFAAGDFFALGLRGDSSSSNMGPSLRCLGFVTGVSTFS